MDRALPAWAIDLITDGTPAADLAERGGRAVYRDLIRTAMSAQSHGWDMDEWQDVVTHTGRRLGHQLRTADGRRERSALQVQRTLESAWERAWERRTESAPWTATEAAEVARERAAATLSLIGDADVALDEAQRAVLAHAADQTITRGITRVTLPRAEMVAATGLGLTALRTALRRLEASGLLVEVERGKRRGDRSTREARANVYALAAADAPAFTAFKSRETRPVVPPAQTCSAPPVGAVGAPPPSCSAPPAAAPTTTEETTVNATVTITAASPEALARMLDLLRAQGDVAALAGDQGESTDVGNVVPLRRRDAS